MEEGDARRWHGTLLTAQRRVTHGGEYHKEVAWDVGCTSVFFKGHDDLLTVSGEYCVVENTAKPSIPRSGE